jgi:hypothetical protein
MQRVGGVGEPGGDSARQGIARTDHHMSFGQGRQLELERPCLDRVDPRRPDLRFDLRFGVLDVRNRRWVLPAQNELHVRRLRQGEPEAVRRQIGAGFAGPGRKHGRHG